MDRTFRARITAGQYLFVGLVGALTVYTLWNKYVILALLSMLLLVVLIEKLIRTTYTVNDEEDLVLYYGRFLPGKLIWAEHIMNVQSVTYRICGKYVLYHYLQVNYSGKHVKVYPVNEEGFIREMKKLAVYFDGGKHIIHPSDSQ